MKDQISAAVKLAQQEQRHEIDPDRLLRLVWDYTHGYVPIYKETLPKGVVARCNYSQSGRSWISYRGYRATAGGCVKMASTLMHELTHALRHFGVGNTAFAQPVRLDMFTALLGFDTEDTVRMELEAELTAYGVISAFSSHPYYRRFTRDYVKTWTDPKTGVYVDPVSCVPTGLIEWLVEELEERL